LKEDQRGYETNYDVQQDYQDRVNLNLDIHHASNQIGNEQVETKSS